MQLQMKLQYLVMQSILDLALRKRKRRSHESSNMMDDVSCTHYSCIFIVAELFEL